MLINTAGPKYFLSAELTRKMNRQKYEEMCLNEGATTAILLTDEDYEQMVADITPCKCALRYFC